MWASFLTVQLDHFVRMCFELQALFLYSEPRVMTRGLILLRGAEPVVEVDLDKKKLIKIRLLENSL